MYSARILGWARSKAQGAAGANQAQDVTASVDSSSAPEPKTELLVEQSSTVELETHSTDDEGETEQSTTQQGPDRTHARVVQINRKRDRGLVARVVKMKIRYDDFTRTYTGLVSKVLMHM